VPERVRAAERAEIHVRVGLAAGHVLTPHGAVGRGIVPFSVALLEADLAAGPPAYPAPATDDVAIVPVRVPPGAPAGLRPVRVSVYGQVCSASGDCRPPVRATLEVNVVVVPR
jgi:hypothetical protein